MHLQRDGNLMSTLLRDITVLFDSAVWALIQNQWINNMWSNHLS